MEGPLAFWEVQEAMNIDYLDVEIVQSIKMTGDKAKASIAPVYMDSKVTKQVGSSDILYLDGGTPSQPLHPPAPSTSYSTTCPHPLTHGLKQLGLPLAKQPLLHGKHMWTIQWDG